MKLEHCLSFIESDTAAEETVDDAHEAHREAATHAEAAPDPAATARELDGPQASSNLG